VGLIGNDSFYITIPSSRNSEEGKCFNTAIPPGAVAPFLAYVPKVRDKTKDNRPHGVRTGVSH